MIFVNRRIATPPGSPEQQVAIRGVRITVDGACRGAARDSNLLWVTSELSIGRPLWRADCAHESVDGAAQQCVRNQRENSGR